MPGSMRNTAYFISFHSHSNPMKILILSIVLMPFFCTFSTHGELLPFSALPCALRGQQPPLSSSFFWLNVRCLQEMERWGRVRFQYLCPLPPYLAATAMSLFLGSKCPPHGLLLLTFFSLHYVKCSLPCPFGYRASSNFPLLLALTYNSSLYCFYYSNTEHTFVNNKISPNNPIQNAINFS